MHSAPDSVSRRDPGKRESTPAEILLSSAGAAQVQRWFPCEPFVLPAFIVVDTCSPPEGTANDAKQCEEQKQEVELRAMPCLRGNILLPEEPTRGKGL